MMCNYTNHVSLASAVLLILFLVPLHPVYAQAVDSRVDGPPSAELHFARLVYNNAQGSRRAMRGGNAWSTDYADAEHHLMQGLNRLTLIDGQVVDYSGYGGRLVTLSDHALFDYP